MKNRKGMFLRSFKWVVFLSIIVVLFVILYDKPIQVFTYEAF